MGALVCDPVCKHLGLTPVDCSETVDVPLCGSYGSSCGAIASKSVNAELSIELLGTDFVGTFSRVYRQFSPTDKFCSNNIQLEYVLNGTYATHGSSDCGGECVHVRLCLCNRY